MPTHTFQVGMTCTGCSSAVERVLTKLGGINKMDISLQDQKVVVQTSHPADTILECIKKTGKPVSFLSTN